MCLISVIIPAYNVDKYLGRCLDSIRCQSYKDIEIIVIDDGSTDGTAKICDDYAGKDNRIKVVHKKNEGVAEARNDALDLAGGSMIAFSDADDHYEPDMIKMLYDAMISHDADMAACGYYEEYPDHIDEHGTGKGVVVYDRKSAYEDYLKMGGRIGSGLWNKLIRAKVLEDLRFKPYRMGEDVELLCRTVNNCDKVVCIDYAGYHYIHREGSATRLRFSSTNLDIIHVSDEIVEYTKISQPELLKQAYAFHAAWVSAQIQVMHWHKDTRGFAQEKKYIRETIVENRPGYRDNPYIAKADRLFIAGYMWGCYRPLKRLYDIMHTVRIRDSH